MQERLPALPPSAALGRRVQLATTVFSVAEKIADWAVLSHTVDCRSWLEAFQQQGSKMPRELACPSLEAYPQLEDRLLAANTSTGIHLLQDKIELEDGTTFYLLATIYLPPSLS